MEILISEQIEKRDFAFKKNALLVLRGCVIEDFYVDS